MVEAPCNTVLGFAEPVAERPVQIWVGDELLRGFGAPDTKSMELSLVSKQPSFKRRSAVVFVSKGAVPEPSKQSVPPYPTRSTIPAAAALGQAAVIVVVLFTIATFVDVELTGMVPIASGVGRLSVPPAP